jgi:hypothetical protein
MPCEEGGFRLWRGGIGWQESIGTWGFPLHCHGRGRGQIATVRLSYSCERVAYSTRRSPITICLGSTEGLILAEWNCGGLATGIHTGFVDMKRAVV